MYRTTPDIGKVTALLDEIAHSLVLPRFSRLVREEIQPKSTPGNPDDVVTIIDQQVEEQLSKALAALSPTAAILGEEAVHRRPELLRLLESDQPLWVIDPIDGTKNFAVGNDGFGIMLAWVVRGRTEAAWIVLPARKQVFIAETGSGAFLNGTRIRVPSGPPGKPVRGMVMAQYMPEPVSKAVVKATRGRFWSVKPSGCAAVEYTDILQGRNEFVVYYRLLPWDHAAPALLLTEAGGRVAHVDGSPYSVRAKNQLTVVARNDAVADQVRDWLA